MGISWLKTSNKWYKKTNKKIIVNNQFSFGLNTNNLGFNLFYQL